jgi:glycosyltransferase involved in cell wall biosynthesis
MRRSPESLALGMTTTGDPEDPTASSGLPTSLLGALRELVGQVVAISDVPSGTRARVALTTGTLLSWRPSDFRDMRAAKIKLYNVGQASGPFAAARARSASAQLAGKALDGFIQNGADYRSPVELPMITFQDSTLIQAVRAYPWPHLRGLSKRDVDGFARRQRGAYESAVACCVVTRWVADSIISDYGIPAEKVHVVGLGANHRALESGANGREWSTPRFLFVGLDWERKNGQAVLDAFARLRDRHPDATLDLVGGHPRVAVEGVTGHGPLAMNDPAGRSRLAELYGRATAFVMPSLHEPSGTVLIEAASAGIPSIGTSNGGAETCIGDGGYVVDPLASQEILDAMLELCNPDTARRLGGLAREHAKLFTWRKTAERLVRAFDLPDVDLTGYAEFL